MSRTRAIYPRADYDPSEEQTVLRLLSEGEIVACEALPWGSNYSFAVAVHVPGQPEHVAVYKPCQGEAPLWDFPSGTLYRREQAAYVLSRLLGWPRIPPTVVREGPHGVGTVQLFIPPREAAYRDLRHGYTEDLQRMALFDLVANNADRKYGHVLPDTSGRLWGIDHGLTFHAQFKLRTIIWDFGGEPIPADLVRQLEQLCEQPMEARVHAALGEWISRGEVAAFYRRVEHLALTGHFPVLDSYRHVPRGW